MNILQELVFIISRKKLSAVELLTEDNSSLLSQLYNGVASNDFMNDNLAAKALFKQDGQSQNYQKLKSVLKGRLIDYLFLIDLSEPYYNDRQKAYYECYKKWAAVKILLGKNARTSAVSLCLNILKQAQRFEFTELILDISRMLRLHYGTRKGNIKKYEQYNQLFKAYEKLWSVENEAEGLYTGLVLHYVNSKASKPEIGEMAKAYYEQLAPYLEKYDSYRLRFSTFFIQLAIYMNGNDYLGSIEVAREAIDYFEDKDYQATAPLLIFLYQQLVCFTQLKEYEKGKKVAERCLELVEENSFNWFKFQENYFLLAMHSGRYQEAYRIFQQTMENIRFSYLPEQIIELWKIFEAYVHYLITLGKIEACGEEDEHKFRMSRFLNDIPIYSKDKRGMNIAILTIQILFIIQQQKFETAADRIDSVRKYAYRYLVNGQTYRSNCFIQMLARLPSAHYHKQAVIRKTQRLRAKLEEVPLEVANQAHDIEIIPYEQLWDLALDSLESKFRRGRLKKRSKVS
ncbi:MAG: hypothetical protein KDD02_11270 [Phaeodactylibacter sp.]|nr:hypothetical protein [Phaeodactylibacter sp.]